MTKHITLKQSLAGVGPGWADLVTHVHHLCTSEHFALAEVKNKMGSLWFVVAWESETGLSAERLGVQRMLQRAFASTEDDSLRTCESCNGWAELRRDGPVPGAHRTLCDACFARWMHGAVTWAQLRGESE